jgi:CRISPR-associated protein Csb2
MPIVAGPTQKTTLVFDTWAEVHNGVVSVTWDCDLDQEARDLLGLLASHLNYLGRSESWVEARLYDDGAVLDHGTACYPHVDGTRPGPCWEQVTLLAPEVPEAFRSWRDTQVKHALAAFPLPPGTVKIPKKLVADRAKAVAPYPEDWIDALQWDTARWKQHRWSQAPGSRRVLYWRRSDALEIARPAAAVRLATPPVQAMLLALTTSSGRRGGLPPVTRALPQAELLHRALIGRLGKGGRIDCPELVGKDAKGQPLIGHRHAHLLPLDLDGDGFLDHILVHAPMGMDALAQSAIRGLRRTHTKGADDLQVAVAASGRLEDLRNLGEPIGDGLRRVLGPAAKWLSITPFVPTRHIKRNGANTLQGQIAAELASRSLPKAAVTVLPSTEESVARSLRHHVRIRRDATKAPPVNHGFALQISFEQPISGPISLGYASHFGLGLMAADGS